MTAMFVNHSPLDGEKITFDDGNSIRYSCDFRNLTGIPSGVEFTVVGSVGTSTCVLKGPGYGGEPYGNGTIYVSRDVVSLAVALALQTRRVSALEAALTKARNLSPFGSDGGVTCVYCTAYIMDPEDHARGCEYVALMETINALIQKDDNE